MYRIIPKVFFLAIFLGVFFFASNTHGNEASLNFYFFWGDGCPHCAKEKVLIEDLKKQYPVIKFYDFEIYNHPENAKLMKEVASALNTVANGVPFTIIGDAPFLGFSETITPEELTTRIEECLGKLCPDSVGSIVGISPPKNENITSSPVPPIYTPSATANIDPGDGINSDSAEHKKTLPLLGSVDVKTFSLPLITLVLGFLDGFNPCAMWALLFLISLLLGMKDKKRMWILGSTFILVSGGAYFLFMAAWLNLILFIGFVVWVRTAIGLIAIGGGGYNLIDFYKNKNSGCKISGDEKRQKIFERIKNAIQQKSFWLAFVGIIILAFAVNMIELVCSAGLPAVYTQILALNDLARWQYYLYILGYIFFFMADDLFVFFVAMITLEMAGITTKYVRASRAIGGLLMLAIGIILIFKPSLLALG